MRELILVIAGVVVLAVIAFVAWRYYKQRRTKELRSQFGPEYNWTVDELRDQGKAEQELEKRQKRVKGLHIHALSSPDRQRSREAWRAIQAQFVDDPKGAVNEADRLTQDVMSLCGYPVADFEQRAADVSVNHSGVVQNYRAAHEIAVGHRPGAASTEELRQAIVCYRLLFEELVETREITANEVRA
jgi:hypothetical protein